jgi:nucleoside-diphosphate-sugar epimerase
LYLQIFARAIPCATQLLGWEPRIELDTGLDKTLEWMKQKIKILGTSGATVS